MLRCGWLPQQAHDSSRLLHRQQLLCRRSGASHSQRLQGLRCLLWGAPHSKCRQGGHCQGRGVSHLQRRWGLRWHQGRGLRLHGHGGSRPQRRCRPAPPLPRGSQARPPTGVSPPLPPGRGSAPGRVPVDGHAPCSAVPAAGHRGCARQSGSGRGCGGGSARGRQGSGHGYAACCVCGQPGSAHDCASGSVRGLVGCDRGCAFHGLATGAGGSPGQPLALLSGLPPAEPLAHPPPQPRGRRPLCRQPPAGRRQRSSAVLPRQPAPPALPLASPGALAPGGGDQGPSALARYGHSDGSGLDEHQRKSMFQGSTVRAGAMRLMTAFSDYDIE